jgi:hypothetical protein
VQLKRRMMRMCEACRYPREYEVGDKVKALGSVVEVIQKYNEPRNGELDRQWYRIKVKNVAGDYNEIDMPCNTLCYADQDTERFIFSKPTRCEICREVVRLKYPENSGMHGEWSCECGAIYPFAFYDIKADTTYTE